MTPENDPSTLTTAELVSHLWSRRVPLLLLPIITVGVTYFLIRAFGGETFESTALVMLRDRPVDERNELDNRTLWIDPPTYKDILLNDETLKGVVDATRAKFGNEFGSEKYEKLKDGFQVRTVTTRDTAVVTTFSPVIEISAQGPKPEISKFMVDEWIKRAVQMYGTLGAADAIAVAKATAEVAAVQNEELLKAKQAEAATDYELDRLKVLIDAYSTLFYDENIKSRITIEPPKDEESQEFKEYVPWEENPYRMAGMGLLEQRAQVMFAIAELQPSTSERAKSRRERLERRLDKIEFLINETNENIVKLSQEAAKLEGEVAKYRSTRMAADNALKSLNEMAGYAAADSILIPDSGGSESLGVLRVLAHPIVPEFRVGPKRSILSIAAGFAMGVFLLLSVIGEAWLRKALGKDRAST
jgi:hypothetical protein